jgi:hypothetical protein
MDRATPSHEVFKPIAGFESIYEVSNFGRVKRVKGQSPTYKGRICAPRPNLDGYHRVCLCNAPNTDVDKFVHVLVLETFVGPCPPGMEACHGDGNPGNPNLSNLRWDTPANNALDKRRHAKTAGEKHANAKITDAEADEIRRAIGSGRALGRVFGVSQQTISDIKRGARRRAA